MKVEEQPKKISPDQVEIIGAHGEVVKEAKANDARPGAAFGFSQMKVIQGSPWMLLFLPVLIPVLIFAFFFIAVFALIFGRGLFKVAGRNVRKN